MFYIMYLTNLCHRRRWADPLFETHHTRRGWTCRVRVNNREYTCDTAYASEELARDKAAESAYMICRNFSVNDGMYPGQKQGQAGVVQGLPVAIGTGRRSRYKNDYESTSSYSGSSSGDSSPRTSDTELDTTDARRPSASTNAVPAESATVCYCRRAYVSLHGRCEYCVREAQWY
ncbi:uncharacterized protein PV09_06518 [Verruconis gallopava]|uniref:DRBM domain-containing protein n=1 Tax=Verruconis gallopava TaxID=253628 RepID=A0A0D1YMQ0_9PEZI|nr:uncharacterized protein PV09_06518 [Verruconis gallopava]KIW02012.1 hypothetical protein PV09_06518 [Verruconis gallopava]